MESGAGNAKVDPEASTVLAMEAVPGAGGDPVAPMATTELAMPVAAAPHVVVSPPPAPEVPHATRAPARSARTAWIVGGGVLVAALVGAGAMAVLHHPSPSQAVLGRRFAQLTNRELRARIDAAHVDGVQQLVLDVLEKPGDPVTTFVLRGLNRTITLTRSADTKAAQAVEQAYLKQGGPTATARDGTAVLHVEVHQAPFAHALLEQITR